MSFIKLCILLVLCIVPFATSSLRNRVVRNFRNVGRLAQFFDETRYYRYRPGSRLGLFSFFRFPVNSFHMRAFPPSFSHLDQFLDPSNRYITVCVEFQHIEEIFTISCVKTFIDLLNLACETFGIATCENYTLIQSESFIDMSRPVCPSLYFSHSIKPLSIVVN